MLEEAPCISSRYSIEGPAHRFNQNFAGARLELAQRRLQFGKGLLDGIEIGRVGRQVDQLASYL
jgi:hypothetical protein